MKIQQGDGRARFEGWYLKHQCGDQVLALIPGIQSDREGRRSAFLQVITKDVSRYLTFPASSYHANRKRFGLRIGENIFSSRGIRLSVDTPEVSLHGALRYGKFDPLHYDIMGPFELLPFLECSHGVVSMSHSLYGTLTLNGEKFVFDSGKGYIESDSGHSFPRSYLWTQCSDFAGEDCSILISAAEIPLGGLRFPGCICAIHRNRQEIRLATYLGGRVTSCDRRSIVLRQGSYCLRADLIADAALPLQAPQLGGMTRIIRESAACRVRYRLWENGHLAFDLLGRNAGFEFVGNGQALVSGRLYIPKNNWAEQSGRKKHERFFDRHGAAAQHLRH